MENNIKQETVQEIVTAVAPHEIAQAMMAFARSFNNAIAFFDGIQSADDEDEKEYGVDFNTGKGSI